MKKIKMKKPEIFLRVLRMVRGVRVVNHYNYHYHYHYHYLQDLFHLNDPSDDFLVPRLVALIVILVAGPGLLQNTGGEWSAVVVPVISGTKGGVLS